MHLTREVLTQRNLKIHMSQGVQGYLERHGHQVKKGQGDRTNDESS